MSKLYAAWFVMLLGMSPSPVQGQSALELLQSISIPVERGEGTLLTPLIPTLGVTLAGCAQVYPGLSGRWDIEVRDPLGDGLIEESVQGGEPVTFNYTTGAQAQLSLKAQWSEARDTTLLLWVGLALPGREQEACEPVYGSGP
jgi:hypothetical protein